MVGHEIAAGELMEDPDLLTRAGVSEGENTLMEFLGYTLVEIGYFSTSAETKWQRENRSWMDRVGLRRVGFYFVNTATNSRWRAKVINFTTSWDLLMQVMVKLEEKLILPKFTPDLEVMVERCLDSIEILNG